MFRERSGRVPGKWARSARLVALGRPHSTGPVEPGESLYCPRMVAAGRAMSPAGVENAPGAAAGGCPTGERWWTA